MSNSLYTCSKNQAMNPIIQVCYLSDHEPWCLYAFFKFLDRLSHIPLIVCNSTDWPPFWNKVVQIFKYDTPSWLEVIVRLAVKGPTETFGLEPVWARDSHCQTHPPAGHIGSDERSGWEGYLQTVNI